MHRGASRLPCARAEVCVMSGDEPQMGVRGGITQITPTDGQQEGSKVSDRCVVCVFVLKWYTLGKKRYKKECVCVCICMEVWVGDWNKRLWPGAALTWAIITIAPPDSLPSRESRIREGQLTLSNDTVLWRIQSSALNITAVWVLSKG